MNSEPTTPVRVPKAASTYTPTTQDPDLRSQINTILLRDGHISKIQDSLLHALNASPTNWPTLIQAHALALLRSGDYTTFPALMARVLEDVKADTAAARSAEEKDQKEKEKNGTGLVAKEKGGKKPAPATVPALGKGKGEDGRSLALPRSVVDEGVRITKECLDLVVEVE